MANKTVRQHRELNEVNVNKAFMTLMVVAILFGLGMFAASLAEQNDAHTFPESIQCAQTCGDDNFPDDTVGYSTCLNYCAKVFVGSDVVVPSKVVAVARPVDLD